MPPIAEEEELVDYEEEVPEEVPAAGSAAATAGKTGAAADGEKKGSYVGIHSTGFRCVQ